MTQEIQHWLQDELRYRFPGAINAEAMEGSFHQARAEAARMERRGEIVIVERRSLAGGSRARILYVRMKTRQRARAERLARWSPAILGALALIGFVAYMLWSVRALLADAGLAIVITAALLWLVPHWRSGCPGIHCTGCGG